LVIILTTKQNLIIDSMMQYPLYPQYPNYPQQKPTNKNQKFFYILIFAVLVAVVVIATLLLKPMSGLYTKCGDGVCDEKENCKNCADDCACKTDEYCSEQSSKCVKPICGNGKCEVGETSLNCCEDCKCELKQEICNTKTHACQLPEIAVSDERVKELVTNYFASKGQQVASIGSIESGIYNNEIVKRCVVKLVGDGQSIGVVVTAAGQVIEQNEF
jgi:hypothetical protein